MQSDRINKLNGISAIFRFVTPIFQILLTIASTLILMYLTGLKTDMKILQAHFENHLKEHKQIEMILEKRLTILETLINKWK